MPFDRDAERAKIEEYVAKSGPSISISMQFPQLHRECIRKVSGGWELDLGRPLRDKNGTLSSMLRLNTPPDDFEWRVEVIEDNENHYAGFDKAVSEALRILSPDLDHQFADENISWQDAYHVGFILRGELDTDA